MFLWEGKQLLNLQFNRMARLCLVTVKDAMLVIQRRLMAFRTTRSTSRIRKSYTLIRKSCKHYYLSRYDKTCTHDLMLHGSSSWPLNHTLYYIKYYFHLCFIIQNWCIFQISLEHSRNFRNTPYYYKRSHKELFRTKSVQRQSYAS